MEIPKNILVKFSISIYLTFVTFTLCSADKKFGLKEVRIRQENAILRTTIMKIKRTKFSPFFAQNIDAGNLIELFLVSAVSSVLIIRAFLLITGYPGIRGGQYHIAHMLWGGLLMALSIFILLSFLNKESRKVSAFVGGIGFGAFIDELGKYITRDNNYFFSPTISLIYVIFICIFLASRLISRKIRISKRDYAINALEVAKEVIFYDLDSTERALALNYLKKSDPKNNIVRELKRLFKSIETLPTPPPHIITQVRNYFTNIYKKLIGTKWFSQGIVFFFVVFASFRFIKAILFWDNAASFSEYGQIFSSLLSGVFVFYGILQVQRGKLLRAFIMFKRAVVTDILLTQFFLFFREQLSAIVALLTSVIIYAVLQYLVEQERGLNARENLHKKG